MSGVFSHDKNRDLNSSNLFMKLSAFVYIQDKLLILKSLSPITELELSILIEFTALCTVLAPRATLFYWHFYDFPVTGGPLTMYLTFPDVSRSLISSLASFSFSLFISLSDL